MTARAEEKKTKGVTSGCSAGGFWAARPKQKGRKGKGKAGRQGRPGAHTGAEERGERGIHARHTTHRFAAPPRSHASHALRLCVLSVCAAVRTSSQAPWRRLRVPVVPHASSWRTKDSNMCTQIPASRCAFRLTHRAAHRDSATRVAVPLRVGAENASALHSVIRAPLTALTCALLVLLCALPLCLCAACAEV
jgi:hypothetical protein